MPETCKACNGSRRVQRRVERAWWQLLLLRPPIVDELCAECGGIGVVRGSPAEEHELELRRRRNREEQDRAAAEQKAQQREALARRSAEAGARRATVTTSHRAASGVGASEETRKAYTIALTTRMINNSLRAIEQSHGVEIRQSDAKQLLAIHTDIMSHLRLSTDFGGAREALLRAHVCEMLRQCRDILLASGDQLATIAEHELTKAELVDAMDIVLGTTLLVVNMLRRSGTCDAVIDQLVAALPAEECGSFAKDTLRQLR